jgi:hypothetical protein
MLLRHDEIYRELSTKPLLLCLVTHRLSANATFQSIESSAQ